MIHIANFDTEMKGKTFDEDCGGTTYTCVGYGDNRGNPYLVGMYANGDKIYLKTVLLKNVEFLAPDAQV
jgi:hypothetical protein